MDQATLRQELLELILLLQQLNPLQVKDLCGFLGTDPADNWFIALGIFLERCTVDQIDALLSLVTSPDLDTVQQEELRKRLQPQASEANITEKEVEDGFSLLLQLYYLQNLLVNLSILQLMKLFEVIPQGSQIQQQQILSQVQTLFAKLQPEALLNLHRQVEQAQPGTEQQTLVTLLNLPLDHFQLYQPLRVILQLDIDELLKLQEVLPKLQGTQIKQLVQLLQLTAYEVIEYRQMLNPYENALNDVELLSLTAPSVSPSINVEVPPPAPPVEKRYWLQIVEQPPEKSVYKRNLKPNPMVMVQGDAKLIPNLYVAVVLLRCDTFTEEAKFITGNRPEKVTSGRVVTFRKLKVTTTSHQQQETLFCLKFELRKYSSENEFELLDFIHSNPVCVLSHSTQMKPVPTAAPVITEVIPSCGPPSGGTRVAILGSNFVESPAARIKFDQTDVMPIFHGPGTLICHTPQHQPGMVTVRVCNSNKKWSDTSASFTYDQSLESLRDSLQEGILARQNYELNEPGSLTQASWGGGFDSVRRIQETGVNLNTIDTRGYTALHYACARANSQITSFLLDHGAVPDVQDKRGFTALFWAIAAECEESVQSLIDQGSDLNIQNFDGFSPLHLAVSTGNSSIVSMLLESGAMANIETMDGETPLHSAVANGDVNIIKLLLQYGAFLNVVDSEGDTPLHWAVRESKKEAVKILIENGVIVDAVNNDDETPLHLAFTYGETQIVDMLMIADASVDTQDLTGSSPLHEAAAQWSAAYVTELLRRGARVGIRDQYGETPLFGAVQNTRDQTVATVMLQYGSDPNVRNSIGQSPLDAALPEIRQSLTFIQNKSDRVVYDRKENWFCQSKPSSSSFVMGMGDGRFLFNEEMSKKMESLMGSPFLFAAPTTPFS